MIVFVAMEDCFAQLQPVTPRPRRRPTTTQQPTGSTPTDSDGLPQQSTAPRKDSLGFERRDDAKDSINISYRYLDSSRRNQLDSSIEDFDVYFSIPSWWQHLGNNGAAAFPLVYQPFLKPGWDAGFHAFDLYRFTLENTRFYKTSRPFSSLSYQLASGREQMLKASHNQNPRPNFNAGFDYRLISAPGFFLSQNTNHNAYRLFANYQGKRKRYNSYFILVGNTIRAAQNGGIQNDSFLLDPNRKDRFSVPVNLGDNTTFNNNPFVTTVSIGSTFKDFNVFFRQSYDVGKKDSVAINDSTTEFLFYPKLRIQHSITSSSFNYQYIDVNPDSAVYKNWYNLNIDGFADTIRRGERWKILTNDFSLVQFPDTKNTSQFISAGITLQNIKGYLRSGDLEDYNIWLHGEYRNRTRNRVWDMLLKGEFFFAGFNAGDYNVSASLSRFLNKRFGDVSVFFNNVNRTPSFVFDKRSSFNLGNNNDFNKENLTSFGITASNPYFTLGFRNHLITNYTYFRTYYQSSQYSKPINIVQVFGSKKFKISRRWNYYLEATFQQTDGASPIRVPLLYTRSRLAYEGRFFKNLRLSTGIEARYFTPYKANNYSPFISQFVPQDSVTVKNLPDIHLFVHFRIRGFSGFIRGENLNTVSFKNDFGFVNNNFSAPLYPTQGLILRFGIQWWLVN